MTAIAFPITAKCEENCEFCFIQKQEDLSLEKFKQLLAEAVAQKPAITKVVITGGNPELNFDFFAICEEVKRCNLRLKIHSNYYNTKTWEKYLAIADELSMPIDSLAGNDFRSSKSVKNFLAAFDFFLAKVTIQVHTVVSRKNIHELQAIYSFLANLHFFPRNSWKLFRFVAVNGLSAYSISDQEWEHIRKNFARARVVFVDDVLHYKESPR